MWIFDKLFNRKIEGKSSLDDLAENIVVNKETNTTEIVGNLDVGGNITKNGQPLGGGGTKLYKHHIEDSNMGYVFTLITTNNQQIDFSIINNSKKLFDYLQTQNVISFTIDGRVVMFDGVETQYFFTIYIRKDGNISICSPSYYEDWDFTATTDIVTEL